MADTEKLGLPIPEATAGGDANDVQRMAGVITDLLEEIDRSAGDYITGLAYQNLSGLINSGSNKTAAQLLNGHDFYIPSNDGNDPDKIGWSSTGESDWSKINPNGTIEIIKGGTYNIFVGVEWTTAASAGGVVVKLDRSDVQTAINDNFTFVVGSPITGHPALNYTGGGGKVIKEFTGPHFYQAGAVITPTYYVFGSTVNITVTSFNLAIERL